MIYKTVISIQLFIQCVGLLLVVVVAKNLAHLIMKFRNGTGWDYDDYKFKANPSSNGKKYKPKKFSGF